MLTLKTPLYCNDCASGFDGLLNIGNGEVVSTPTCPDCGSKPRGLKLYPGGVYIACIRKAGKWLPHVKIGLTQGDAFKRMKQLSTTGTPGDYFVTAWFHSTNPKADEDKLHHKLRKHHTVREHFDLEPALAIASARSCFQRDPSYVDSRVEAEYRQVVERNRVAMGARLGRSN